MTNIIAAEKMRDRIPTSWVVQFEQMTNEELAFWAKDVDLKPEVKAYCGWELDYRVATGLEVYMDNQGKGLEATSELKRRRVHS